MDSSHLSPQQVASLTRAAKDYLDYLNKLCARMQTLRFPADDSLVRAAHTARTSMQALYDTARTCGRRHGAETGEPSPAVPHNTSG